MNKNDNILQLLTLQGLMPLYFTEDKTTSIGLMGALYQSGVRLLEYTNRGATALENFAAMKEVAEQKYPDMYLGAGTIKTKNDAEAFINAGADFLISPALEKKVFKIARKSNVLWIPGCMTPTEILKAERWGLRFVKLFPGNLLGSSYVYAIRELFPAMKFMPTGGVDATKQNIKEWLDAGVSAVGMGSKLITNDIIAGKKYDELIAHATDVLAIINDCKK